MGKIKAMMVRLSSVPVLPYLLLLQWNCSLLRPSSESCKGSVKRGMVLGQGFMYTLV